MVRLGTLYRRNISSSHPSALHAAGSPSQIIVEIQSFSLGVEMAGGCQRPQASELLVVLELSVHRLPPYQVLALCPCICSRIFECLSSVSAIIVGGIDKREYPDRVTGSTCKIPRCTLPGFYTRWVRGARYQVRVKLTRKTRVANASRQVARPIFHKA